MESAYPNVTTRFLRHDERLIASDEYEMPLVIEATDKTDIGFLQSFLSTHSAQLLNDISNYGAVLLRGFQVKTEKDFEESVTSIQGMRGISEAFMSEEGRIHVGDLKYVLFTNAVYKTGGTLYLGGFHSENYYSTDMPAYISFFCQKPSQVGGETGLVNMEKVYASLNDDLKQRLNKNSFFVGQWLVSDVAKRYQLSEKTIEKICKHFHLPIVGNGRDRFILMYKPSVFEDPKTKKCSLQINLFELHGLNIEMRKCFMNDYQGKTWFWHRFVWKLPTFVFKPIEIIYIMCASFFYSPKNAMAILFSKLKVLWSSHQLKHLSFYKKKVGSCFSREDEKVLAQLIRQYYCSCLWQKGDILLVDNRKVVHAGMPGAGDRLVRAMICNPLELNYSFVKPGTITCRYRTTETVGYYMANGITTIKESHPPSTCEID